MGNTTSNHIDLKHVMKNLDKYNTQCSSPGLKTRQMRSRRSPIHAPAEFKQVITVDHDNNYIIKNIQVPNDNYRNVILTLGTQVFNATMVDTVWQINEPIPLFKVPIGECYLTIYGASSGDIKVQYDAYTKLPEYIRLQCENTALVHNNLVYKDGQVY